ncbi:HAD family hydrolase [Streptomyces indicus]|uniref:Putative hydrolase of the HAD superfamily n=1 Tax=Streptomyces indicus TaxID=417292 RepID=A0A1G9HP66_9ACTN|nr:HAD family phosphatase [Streptomyces indicus]SDL14596.1 putative hydrolase of the HAD superfamily [Streptomyces indicus]
MNTIRHDPATAVGKATTTVWFDFGGVLSPPLAELYDNYWQSTGVAPEQLRQALDDVGADLGTNALAPIELGTMRQHEWGGRLRSALVRRFPNLDLTRARLEDFGEQWFNGVEVNPRMAAAVQRIRAAGHPVGILTNNVAEWEPHWRRIIAAAGEVDFVIDSCRVGVRKPDPAIFQLATELSPTTHHTLIDDLTENCSAAIAAGWTAVRFQNNAQTLSELDSVLGISLKRTDERNVPTWISASQGAPQSSPAPAEGSASPQHAP